MTVPNVGGASRLLQSTASGATNAVANLGRHLGLDMRAGKTAGEWMSRLHPASFRGVKFAALGVSHSLGRRYAIHEYPYRDYVWAENLGRAVSRYVVEGFFVTDDRTGADAARQFSGAEATWMQPGAGDLIHPTFGLLRVTLLEVTETQRWQNGRYVEFRLLFIVTPHDMPMFPGVATDTPAAVDTAAAAANAAAAADFATRAAKALKAGLAAVNMAASTVARWARTAQGLVDDATNLYHMAGSLVALPGQLGRYFGGRTKTVKGRGGAAAPKAATSLKALIGAGAVARTSYAAARDTLSAAATSLTAGALPAFAAAAQALASAVAASAADPVDAVRLLTALASPTPAAPTSSTPVGTARAAMQGATGDLFRRSAVIALAQASAVYQPSSYDDAAALRAAVVALIDAEVTTAGNQGEDATYVALWAMQAAVVKDLTARGANLAAVVTVTVGASLPALALAQRLYRDPGRADELVVQTNPVHPAFMPLSFKALAK